MHNRYFFATVIILVGIGFLLNELTIWNFGFVIGTWWPILIVLFGIFHISKYKNNYLPGIFIIIIGLLLQANQLDMLRGGFWGAFWPIVLIMLGLSIIFHRGKHFRRFRKIHDDYSGFTDFFSGSKHKIETENFEGTEISVMFGGNELDLRRCTLSPNGAVIDVSVSFGGAVIHLPESWNLKLTGSPLFGGLDNKTRNRTSSEVTPTLHIKYFVMFGGIELKN